VLPLATAIGLVLAVVPGVLIYVYFSLAPAIVKIDHVGMREAMRRSRQAVHGNFWRVLAVFVLVVGVAGVVEQLLQSLFHEFIGLTVTNLVVETLGAPFYGLATVLMAFALCEHLPAREANSLT
jgi:hypothetical protein